MKNDADDRAAWLGIEIDELGADYVFATRSNVLEVETLVLKLTRVMPPQTSLRQAVAFIMIGRLSVSGMSVTAARLAKFAGDDVRRQPVLGPSIRRTIAPLIDLGLVKEVPCEDDLRARNLSLTPSGMELLRTAMDSIS